jgi:hypothetical protein
VEKYIKLASDSKKRKLTIPDTANEAGNKRMKQQSMQESLCNANLVTQFTLDKCILNYITQALLPLRTVELPSFVELINSLQPNRTVMSRATLRSKIVASAQTLKTKLVTILKNQKYEATTTDYWSAFGKSYIGVTVHWIDQETLHRQSACLALRRMKGLHTFDAIAAILEDIHTEFGIRRKLIRTTTDNGSNFVKAFSVFGQKIEDDDDNDTEQEDEIDSDAAVYDVSEALGRISTHDYQLPRHHRCACHTLNLVSMADAEKAEADAGYKRVSRSAFAKCQGLRNP